MDGLEKRYPWRFVMINELTQSVIPADVFSYWDRGVNDCSDGLI